MSRWPRYSHQTAAYVTSAGADWLASASPFRAACTPCGRTPRGPVVLPCGSAFDVITMPPVFGRLAVTRLWCDGPGPARWRHSGAGSCCSRRPAAPSGCPRCWTGRSGHGGASAAAVPGQGRRGDRPRSTRRTPSPSRSRRRTRAPRPSRSPAGTTASWPPAGWSHRTSASPGCPAPRRCCGRAYGPRALSFRTPARPP
ncbi:hypothetical protein NKH77_20205 [Streptomyces sp. M19]